MWEMWYIYFMHIEQLYCVYGNLNVYTGNMENCLCINRREVGLHVDAKGPEDLCRLMKTWKTEYIQFPSPVTRLDWDGTLMGNIPY